MQLACTLLIGFLVAYGTWTIVSAWANCVPLAKFYDPSVPGFCFDKEALWFSNSAIHILTDLIILVYPMPVLRSLQLPRRQKVALMGVFALGGLYVYTPPRAVNRVALANQQIQRVDHQYSPSKESPRHFELHRSNL